MKCWKCGAEIPAGASVCTYCSASMVRKSAVTEAGKAMRQIYDRFGFEKVFDKKSILPVALGDLLEDSRKLRTYVEMALSTGVGNIYISQLRGTGKTDAAFHAKVKVLITEDAGLSDKIATELMGYFDEMIGWSSTVQAANPTPPQGTTRNPAPSGGSTASRTVLNRDVSRPAPSDPAQDHIDKAPTEAQRALREQALLFARTQRRMADRENPENFRAGVDKNGLPTAMVPQKPAGDKNYYQKPACFYKKGVLEVRWFGKLDKFALAINCKWVATGSGNRIQIPIDLGLYSTITVAEITDNGVKFFGDCTYHNRKKLYKP